MNILLIFPVIGLVLALVMIYSTTVAIKKFGVVIWKKGWYVIALAGFILVLASIYNMLFHYMFSSEEWGALVLNVLYTMMRLCIVIGIFILANTASKLWGGKTK